jgi:hypothetical protein
VKPDETLPAKSSSKGKGSDRVKEKGKAVDSVVAAPAKDGGSGRTAPETVNGNTHVNVAFPFSKIEVQEPTAELVELAGLLYELIGALAEWVPEESVRDIRSRAEALCARLAG